jgi:hypothetical protein
MYIDMYQIENYLIEIPDNTSTDEIFDEVQREWNSGSYTPDDCHTFIGDSALEASKFLLDHTLELHKHQLEEFCTVLYQKLDEKYDISVASVVDSTIVVNHKIGPLLHSKIIKAETIEKALNELESFFS